MQKDAPDGPEKQVGESPPRNEPVPDVAVPAAVIVTLDTDEGTNATGCLH